jgi:ketosteroid isomerase-like protein
MSRENRELVESFAAGVGAMDKQALLAALPDLISQMCDPDIEWVEDPSRADGRVYRGHAGVRASFERWLEGFEEYGFEIERVEDCGDEVRVVAREQARGSASGAAISARNYSVMTIRGGKLLRYREFYDENAARQAAGLPA